MKVSFWNSEFFAILAALFWGMNYSVIKRTLGVIPENQFLVIRFGVTVLLLLLIMRRQGESLRFRRQDFWHIAILGFIGVGLYNILWTAALHRTTATNAALIIDAAPIFTTLYAAISREERVTAFRWWGIGMAFLGISLIVLLAPGARFSLDSVAFTGDLLCLLAALIFSVYNILAKPLLREYSPLKLTTLVMALGLVLLIPNALFSAESADLLQVSSAIWFNMAYTIVLGTVVAYVFWYKGIQKAGAAKTVIYHFLVSVVSMIVSPLALGEAIGLGQLLGAGLVFAGLVITRVSPESLFINSHLSLARWMEPTIDPQERKGK